MAVFLTAERLDDDSILKVYDGASGTRFHFVAEPEGMYAEIDGDEIEITEEKRRIRPSPGHFAIAMFYGRMYNHSYAWQCSCNSLPGNVSCYKPERGGQGGQGPADWPPETQN